MKKLLRNSYLSLIYLFFYIPLGVLILYSFNDAHYSLLWQGFTLEWYKTLFKNTDLWIAAGHSLVLGIFAASIATVIGTLASISLYRYRFFGKNLLHGLIFILILAPDIILGIALLILFNLTDISLGFISLLIAHITFCIPFVVVTVYSRITSLDKYLFEAAQDLGASDLRIIGRIIIPLLWPALLAAFLLSFTLSFDDVIVSYFVAGPSFEILPLKIYSLVRSGIKPEINALCTIIFAITITLVMLAHLTLRKKT